MPPCHHATNHQSPPRELTIGDNHLPQDACVTTTATPMHLVYKRPEWRRLIVTFTGYHRCGYIQYCAMMMAMATLHRARPNFTLRLFIFCLTLWPNFHNNSRRLYFVDNWHKIGRSYHRTTLDIIIILVIIAIVLQPPTLDSYWAGVVVVE